MTQEDFTKFQEQEEADPLVNELEEEVKEAANASPGGAVEKAQPKKRKRPSGS